MAKKSKEQPKEDEVKEVKLSKSEKQRAKKLETQRDRLREMIADLATQRLVLESRINEVGGQLLKVLQEYQSLVQEVVSANGLKLPVTLDTEKGILIPDK